MLWSCPLSGAQMSGSLSFASKSHAARSRFVVVAKNTDGREFDHAILETGGESSPTYHDNNGCRIVVEYKLSEC